VSDDEEEKGGIKGTEGLSWLLLPLADDDVRGGKSISHDDDFMDDNRGPI